MKRQATPSPQERMRAALAPLLLRWRALSPRERHLGSLAAAAVGILLVWAIFLAPALRSLQKVQLQRVELDGQLQRMLALRAEARQLSAQPRIGRDTAVRALQESTAPLGSGAQLQVSGERAVLTLRGVPAASLAAWLSQARTNARVVPLECRLVRSVARTPAATGSPNNPGGAMPSPQRPAGAAGAAGGINGFPNSPPPDYQPNPPAPAGAQPFQAATPPADVRWDGTVVLVLPAG